MLTGQQESRGLRLEASRRRRDNGTEAEILTKRGTVRLGQGVQPDNLESPGKRVSVEKYLSYNGLWEAFLIGNLYGKMQPIVGGIIPCLGPRPV